MATGGKVVNEKFSTEFLHKVLKNVLPNSEEMASCPSPKCHLFCQAFRAKTYFKILKQQEKKLLSQ